MRKEISDIIQKLSNDLDNYENIHHIGQDLGVLVHEILGDKYQIMKVEDMIFTPSRKDFLK